MIGRFASLSCADTSNINSYYNGTKYSYVMYKNGGGINIDKIGETVDSSFKNGLEVSVKVSCSQRELEKAINKLMLFEKLHITYNALYSYSAITSVVERFNAREVTHFKTFSICPSINPVITYYKVGNVLYSVEGYDPELQTHGLIIHLPVGEEDITPNREALQFTERTKNTIDKAVAKVKEELQEFVNSKEGKDFSLFSYYSYIKESYIHFEDKNTKFTINKEDVQCDYSKCTINGNVPPKNFDKFIKDVSLFTIDSEFIYKVINEDDIKYGYKKITKGNCPFAALFSKAILCTKEDTVTRSLTLQWFTEKYEDECVIIVSDLEKIKDKILSYISFIDNKQECLDFLFSILEIKRLSNADVPTEYKEAHKVSKKKKDTNVNEITIRKYFGSTYSNYFLRSIDTLGTRVYALNTKEDGTIKAFANLFSEVSAVHFITFKKEDISVCKNDKRYISLQEFMDTRNSLISKLVTCYIIKDNFSKLVDTRGYDIYKTPIYQEFSNKYDEYLHSLNCCSYTYKAFAENLVKSYKDKGWYNKADVAYYSLNENDLKTFDTIKGLEKLTYRLPGMVAFLLCGKNQKVGISSPDAKVYKYLKLFKHERI